MMYRVQVNAVRCKNYEKTIDENIVGCYYNKTVIITDFENIHFVY